MPVITLPFKFSPREYQLPLLSAIDKGIKNIFVLWNRRAGKDLVLWNACIKRAFQVKGIHYYLLPTYTQAKKIIFDGITNDGTRFIDYIPPELLKRKNEQELKIELINGSIIQLIGTDRYDSIRGSNPITCIFSEYAYQNPMAYEVVKPILAANGGIAIFNTTPNGKNHSAQLREVAENSTDWYYEKLTVNETKVVSLEEIARLKSQGMSEEFIQQEFFCSEDIGIVGSFYADRVQTAKEENRICANVYEPTLEVHTAWDIGFRDDTAITFFQIFGKEIRIVDYYANSGMTMPEYIAVLKNKPYKYGTHYLPWDAKITPMSSGKSTIDVAKEYGLDNIRLTPNLSVQEGIQQARMILQKCWFDKDKTVELVNALQNYRREYDEKKQAYRAIPLHDWSSHGADSFRYLAISIKDSISDKFSYENSVKTFLKKTDSSIMYDDGLGFKKKDFQEYEKSVKSLIINH